jgi:hypothetical protein
MGTDRIRINTGLETRATKPVSTQRNDLKNTAKLERETGIEPASLAWKARVLPLNYSRSGAPNLPLIQTLGRDFLVEEAGFEPAYS